MATYENFPRPTDPYYEQPPRHRYLSQGDILADVPLTAVGPIIEALGQAPAGDAVAAVQPILVGPAMILTRTCHFRHPSFTKLDADPNLLPYTLRTYISLAPIYRLESFSQRWNEGSRANNVRLAREYVPIGYAMYLPPMPGLGDGEYFVDLTLLTSVAVALLERLPRAAQLTEVGARQRQFKLVMAATGVFSDRTVFRPELD